MAEATVAGYARLAAVLPEYEVMGEIGRGAMGVVLSARHRTLGRRVAIKELPAAFAADEEVRARFVREGQTVAALSHPHVVVVYDFIDRDGHLALIMEQLGGGTVWDRFTTVGLTAPTACGLVLSTAAGLDHAHRHGVLHRDVKPENLLFTTEGQLKVSDFGMAKVMGGGRTLATADGVVLGTPAYMAPEQAEGAAVGPQADVYACGTLLYEMLCGKLPFWNAATAVAMLVARVKDEAPDLREQAPSIPAAIADVARKALARSTVDRYSAVEEFAVELGHAAASAWGPDWLAQTGVAVTGSETIERASRTSLPPTPRPGGPPERAEGTTGGATIDLRGNGVPQVEAVRGGSRPRLPSVDLRRLSPADMVDIAEVRLPPSPSTAWLGSLALAILGMGVIAVSMLTASVRSVGSSMTVNGARPGSDSPTPVAFDEPVRIDGLGSGATARLEASVLGVPMGVVEAPLVDGGAKWQPGYIQWTTAGVVDVEVTVDGDPAVRARFVAAPTQTWWSTAPAIVAALVGAFGFASLQSNLRGLRGGRLRVGSMIGLGFNGAVLGAASVAMAVMVLQIMPAPAAVIGGMAIFAASAVALGEGYRRRRRRARLTAAIRSR